MTVLKNNGLENQKEPQQRRKPQSCGANKEFKSECCPSCAAAESPAASSSRNQHREALAARYIIACNRRDVEEMSKIMRPLLQSERSAIILAAGSALDMDQFMTASQQADALADAAELFYPEEGQWSAPDLGLRFGALLDEDRSVYITENRQLVLCPRHAPDVLVLEMADASGNWIKNPAVKVFPVEKNAPPCGICLTLFCGFHLESAIIDGWDCPIIDLHE